ELELRAREVAHAPAQRELRLVDDEVAALDLDALAAPLRAQHERERAALGLARRPAAELDAARVELRSELEVGGGPLRGDLELRLALRLEALRQAPGDRPPPRDAAHVDGRERELEVEPGLRGARGADASRGAQVRP